MVEQSVLHRLEGQRVSVALVDGRRIDGAVLVSGVRTGSLWLFASGVDVFVHGPEVLEVWEDR